MSDLNRVLIGIISCGENEYNDCLKSAVAQKGIIKSIYEVKGLGKMDAHVRLYHHFMQNSDDFDFFLKLDGDMVIESETKVFALCERLRKAPTEFGSLEVKVHDFYTDSLIWGLHLYKSNYEWVFKGEKFFTDKIDKTGQKRLLISDPNDPLCPAAEHSPNPSDYQCYHFGVHKATKVLQNGRSSFNIRSSRSHFLNYLKSYRMFGKTKDKRYALVLAGFEWAIISNCDHTMADYNSDVVKKSFQSCNLMVEPRRVLFARILFRRLFN